ncbi:MAG: hypothetical protein R3F14_41600 [Polyangiaceae bacterium]
MARTLLNHLETVRRSSVHPVGILVTGGLGVFLLRDYLGSAFLSRAYHFSPAPFSEVEIGELARRFIDRGPPLGESVVKAIHLASGGNPALATYGLQHLWSRASATERDVADIYSELPARHPDFLRDVRSAVSHPDLSEGPLRVWAVIRREGPRVPRATLLQAAAGGTGTLPMDLDDILRLLRGAGLVTLNGSSTGDPLDLRAVASIINLPERAPTSGDIREQLLGDLRALLASIHRWAPDFFHTPSSARGEEKKPRRIVPEAVFSAILAIGLAQGGWVVEREAVQAEGRTDLKLSRAGKTAIVEVKIWGRNDYERIHGQVEGYWTRGVHAAAAVMLTDLEQPSFRADYLTDCLADTRLTVTEESFEPPLRGHFGVKSTSQDGFDVLVDHLLLRIPRG